MPPAATVETGSLPLTELPEEEWEGKEEEKVAEGRVVVRGTVTPPRRRKLAVSRRGRSRRRDATTTSPGAE